MLEIYLLSFNAPAVVAEEQTAIGMIDVFKSKSVEITPSYSDFFSSAATRAFETKVLNESRIHITTFSSLLLDNSNDTSLTNFNLCGSLSIIEKSKEEMRHDNRIVNNKS